MPSPRTQSRLTLTETMASCHLYSCKREGQTLTMQEVPEFFHELYIYSGYRYVDMPWIYYLKSAFMVHNESMNVWTHSLGFFFILYSLLAFFEENLKNEG